MKKQWRSLEDNNQDSSAKAFLHREFQEGASSLEDAVSRRSFLKLLGGTTALAGLTGCVASIRKPYKKIYPYANKMEHAVPGQPTFYASSFTLGHDVAGVLVETYEGRPTKIEGNPNHPASLGASTVFQQASIMNLYDPDRLTAPKYTTKASSLSAFKDWMMSKRKEWAATKGKGLTLLLEPNASPSFNALLDSFSARYPKATVRVYSSLSNEQSRQAIDALSGVAANKVYDFSSANVVVSIDDDFLGVTGNQIRNTKGFSERRDPDSGDLNRLYTFEPRVSITGSKSDHRYPVKQSELHDVLSCLLYHVAKLVRYDLSDLSFMGLKELQLDFVDTKIIKEVAKDLYHNRGKSLVAVGDHLNADIHKMVLVLNDLLSNNGSTIHYHKPAFEPASSDSLRELANDLNNDKVDALIILGGDPVYSAPYDISLSKAITKASDRVHLVDIENETSRLCNWLIPESSYLESWGDAQTVDGLVSLVQPVIKKMYDSLSAIELLYLSQYAFKSDYSIIRKRWAQQLSESSWKKALHNGVAKRLDNKVSIKIVNKNLGIKGASSQSKSQHLELSFYPDYKVYDGRFSNNSWLQELPDPIHKLTWDNAAFIAPKTAKRLSLSTGDVVELQVAGASLEVPVFVSPGHALNAISMPIGYGKKVDGKVGVDVGVSTYPIRSSDNYDFINKLSITKLRKTHEFASTQDHGQMEGRPHFRYANLDEYTHNPNFANEKVAVPYDKSLWDEHIYDSGYQWGMVIDLNKCTSCNTCITSCQAENNIPVVGKEEIKNGRELHWMRVDRYYEGDENNPDLVSQPVTCLHCENAPCEQVCPVAATVHDKEGLNVMVYNRCVGTRYCSDNCPVKVRRFNFFDYHQRNPHAKNKERFHFFDYMKEPPETLKMQFNPDVTVRMRGVMEKCTYCIQRIKSATQTASNENREIVDGEVVSACQQACPADAIVMGNINDPDSEIARLRKRTRNYSILEQLLLRARTTYLAAVYNPNPNLVEAYKKDKSEVKHVSHH